jgi:hypothetical protein
VTPARTLRFSARRPRAWRGRYRRIPGRTSVIHVRRIDGEWWPVVDWRIGEETGTCLMLDDGDLDGLVEAVHAGKHALGVGPGGSFLVNEFGQVLVPVNEQETTCVVYVGDCDGPLGFENPLQAGKTFDLADSRALKAGDRWERPYVGIVYNLSSYDEICFRQTDATGTRYVEAPEHDPKLVASLRGLRPYGWVRFVVGAGGIALTKVQVQSEWQPHYVGRIDRARWFSKEG